MSLVQSEMKEFRKQLRKGTIQKAYRSLLSFMMDLRTHFKYKHPDSAVSALYQGYMDMSCSAIHPPPLKDRDLKIVYSLQL